MKVFITGGSGFIGTNPTDYLLERGHQVTAVDKSAAQKRRSHIMMDRFKEWISQR